jgi:hypothetical protein
LRKCADEWFTRHAQMTDLWDLRKGIINDITINVKADKLKELTFHSSKLEGNLQF